MTKARYCSKCGTYLESEASFCRSCGTSNTVGIPEASSQAVYEGTSPELPMVDFGEAIQRGLRKFFNFGGRATRAEFWWFFLFWQIVAVLSVIPVIIIAMVPIIGLTIILVGYFLYFFGYIPIMARRLHDIGRSAWWLLAWPAMIVMLLIVSGLLVIQTVDFQTQPSEEDWAVFAAFLMAAAISGLIYFGMGIWWVVWFVKKGDRGPNKHGPDPRQAT